MLVLAALVAGCGGNADSTSVTLAEPELVNVVQESAAATRAAGTSRMEMTIAVSGGGEDATIVSSGVFDHKRAHASFSMELSGLRLDYRMLRSLFYLRYVSGPGKDTWPGGDKWVVIDLKKLASYPGLTEAQRESYRDAVEQLEQATPASNIDYLKGISDVRQVGTESLRGEETTHYAGKADLTAELSEEQRAQLESAGGDTSSLRSTPVDVWLDDAQRLRRLRFVMDLDVVNMETTMELFDYGVAVNVKEPPADQTVDMAKLLKEGPG